MNISNVLKLIGLVSLFFIQPMLGQEQSKPVAAKVEGHIFKPAKREATDERVGKLKVPPGFKVQKFAENLGKPRMIAVAENGDVFITEREKGEVIRLQDTDGDGKADKQEGVAKLDKKKWHQTY